MKLLTERLFQKVDIGTVILEAKMETLQKAEIDINAKTRYDLFQSFKKRFDFAQNDLGTNFQCSLKESTNRITSFLKLTDNLIKDETNNTESENTFREVREFEQRPVLKNIQKDRPSTETVLELLNIK